MDFESDKRFLNINQIISQLEESIDNYQWDDESDNEPLTVMYQQWSMYLRAQDSETTKAAIIAQGWPHNRANVLTSKYLR